MQRIDLLHHVGVSAAVMKERVMSWMQWLAVVGALSSLTMALSLARDAWWVRMRMVGALVACSMLLISCHTFGLVELLIARTECGDLVSVKKLNRLLLLAGWTFVAGWFVLNPLLLLWAEDIFRQSRHRAHTRVSAIE